MSPATQGLPVKRRAYLVPRKCGHLDKIPYPGWKTNVDNQCDRCMKREPEWFNSVFETKKGAPE